VLREQPSHRELAIFRRAPIILIATVELLGHPLRELTFVRVDGGNFIRMLGHVVRERLGKLGPEDLTAFQALGSEAKGRSLQSGIAGRHASDDNPW